MLVLLTQQHADETDICLSLNRSWAQSLLPYTFYFCWLFNLVLNVAWLLLWDREYVSGTYVRMVCCLIETMVHSVLQVDAGGSGCIDPDGLVQLQCFVLLLLRHRLLWTLVADVPSQRPGLSPNTGRTHKPRVHFYSGSYLSPLCVL